MSRWEDLLPESLLDQAYHAANEVAWRRVDAINVIEILERKGLSVDGIEVWIRANDGPIIPLYEWTKVHLEPIKSATEFVSSFAWNDSDAEFHDSEPYFNLTISGDSLQH
jgi:hypothetical protein